MATAGDLVVNLTGRTTGLGKALNRGRSMIGGFASTAVDKLGRIGLAAQGIRSTIDGVRGLVGTPLRLASEVEQANVAFTTMLGSAKLAGQVLKDLSQFSATTPFQLPALRDSAKLLLANKLPAEQLIGVMKVLGDISAGTGTRIIELTRIYNKMRATGRATLENINELMLRNIPIWDLLSSKIGVSKDEIRKMLSAGQIGFRTVNQVLTDLTHSGGMFADAMRKQSTTIGGLWSTLKDNLSLALGEIGVQIIKTFDLRRQVRNLTEMIGSVRTWASENREVVRALALVAGGIAGLAVAVPVVLGIKAAFVSLGVVIGGLMSPIGLVIGGLVGLGSAVVGMRGDWDDSLDLIRFFFRNLELMLKISIERIKIFGSNVLQVFRNLKNLENPLNNLRQTNAKILSLQDEIARRELRRNRRQRARPVVPRPVLAPQGAGPPGVAAPSDRSSVSGAVTGTQAFFDRLQQLRGPDRRQEELEEHKRQSELLRQISKNTGRQPIQHPLTF